MHLKGLYVLSFEDFNLKIQQCCHSCDHFTIFSLHVDRFYPRPWDLTLAVGTQTLKKNVNNYGSTEN